MINYKVDGVYVSLKEEKKKKEKVYGEKKFFIIEKGYAM
jgi:hypothetical protein